MSNLSGVFVAGANYLHNHESHIDAIQEEISDAAT
jgi:hypothetical protein